MSALDPTYSEVGDSEGGFSTRFNMGALRVQAWGFWPREVAEKFGPAVCNACQMAPGIRKLEFNMTRLKPMRDEGQEGFGRIMNALQELPVSEVVVMTSSQLTKLQLLRIAREKAPQDIVRFVEASEYA